MASPATQQAFDSPASAAPRPDQVAHRAEGTRFASLFVWFTIELLAINLARLPESMRFDRYAFCDHGANLTLQYLIANGYRPAVDFGYHYGLLPVLFGHISFALLGTTPWTYQSAMVAFSVLFAWAFARILSELNISRVGLALAIITVGYAYQATYINFAHAIEALLLCHALAQQARGSRSNALAIATVAVFAKPSMGYVYGLLLMVLIVRDLSRSGFTVRRFVASIAPAAIVFACLATLLAYIYGPEAFLHTALPIEGVRNYRALNFGLTRAGRGLWDPTGLSWIFYFIDISGFWIASTLFLFCAAILQLGSADNRTISVRRGELILTCALLHLAFLALFFGNQWSWIYYSYVLMIGTAIALDLTPARRRIGLVFCALALLSWTDIGYWTVRWWRTTAPDAATAGLWAPKDERAEWLRVLAMIHGQKTVMLDSMGAAELLFPGFEPPVSLYLTKGLMLPDDIHRKLAELSGAQIVVVPVIPMSTCSGIPDAPEFASAMQNFEPVMTGKYFEISQRRLGR